MGRLIWPLSTLLTHAVRALGMRRLFPGAALKARFLGVWLALEAKYWLRWWPRRSFRLRWQGPAGEVSARLADISELWAVWETFANGEYRSVSEVAPRVIFDLGANVGISALYFAAVCPGARIVAVEAVPHTYELLRENTRHLDNLTCVHAAITDEVGTVTMYSGAKSLGSSLTAAANLPNAHTVAAITLGRLAEDVGVDAADFVKMDVEGAEVQVIQASSSFLRKAAVIVFEFHQNHTSEPLWALLEQLPDFEVVRIRGDTANRAVVDLVCRRGTS